MSVCGVAFSLPIYFGVVFGCLEGLLPGTCVDGLTSGADAIYFSYVTITTLGYGDLQPIGWCRAVSAFQATLGLLSVGIIPGILLGKHLSES